MTQKSKKPFSIYLWKLLNNPWILFFASVLVLFIMLGTKELWTQEWRWANIAHQMILRHDYFHPFLGEYFYYDKPLISYWLMIAASFITGGFNIWALRLPGVIAGLITVWSVYTIGKRISSKQTGMLAGWILISSFMFVFWARVANTDMLNIAGMMLALVWYFAYRDRPTFFSYLVFFTILAIAALLKGLIAPVLVLVALIPDLLYDNNWQKHLKLSMVIALIIGVLIYFLHFGLQYYFNPNHDTVSGLHLVYQENFLRFFKPFDHEGSIYTYFLALPLYTFPWIFFYLVAIWDALKHWKQKTVGSRWLAWANLLIFAFFTASGSRRNYYILPMLPFVALFTADWIYNHVDAFTKRKKWASYTATSFFIINLIILGILYPLAYSGGGLMPFAKDVRQTATQIKPWKDWTISILDAQSRTFFYLNSPNLVEFIDAKENAQEHPTRATLLSSFPILKNNPQHHILIIQKSYLPYIQDILPKYTVIEEPLNLLDRRFNADDPSLPVALVPVAKE
ncbi:MAG: glycosyltransferase family 39 protein [Pseudomonadota bacterium]